MTATIEYEYDERADAHVETDESFDRRMGEHYAPKPSKPWRVTWGFGCHSDHASEAAARRKYRALRRDFAYDPSGWQALVGEPFRTDR